MFLIPLLTTHMHICIYIYICLCLDNIVSSWLFANTMKIMQMMPYLIMCSLRGLDLLTLQYVSRENPGCHRWLYFTVLHCYVILYYMSLSAYSPGSWNQNCFHGFAVVNRLAVDILIQVSWYSCASGSLWKRLRNIIMRSANLNKVQSCFAYQWGYALRNAELAINVTVCLHKPAWDGLLHP